MRELSVRSAEREPLRKRAALREHLGRDGGVGNGDGSHGSEQGTRPAGAVSPICLLALTPAWRRNLLFGGHGVLAGACSPVSAEFVPEALTHGNQCRVA